MPILLLLCISALLVSTLAPRSAASATVLPENGQTVQLGQPVEDEADAETAPERSRWSFHGFLTAAYGESDGVQFLGLPEDGTDYWNAALQLRFEPTRHDAIAVQLNHESLGESPDSDLRSDVELDWAIYQHRFGARTWLRAGRLPIPLGIYNEIRDVGTLLPFYRPPVNVYRQGGSGFIVVETIDGLLLGRSIPLARSWNLEGEAYYGGFDLDELSQLSGRGFVPTRGEDALGATFWLETPISGLRFGLGALRSRLTGDDHQPGDEFRYWIASIEAVFDRFSVRAEHLTFDADLLIARVEPYRGSYLELGVRLTRRLSLFVQGERARITVSLPPLVSGLGLDFNDDVAVGLRYALRDNLVAKLEMHDNEGFLGDGVAINIFAPPPETRYGIVSVAVSF